MINSNYQVHFQNAGQISDYTRQNSNKTNKTGVCTSDFKPDVVAFGNRITDLSDKLMRIDRMKPFAQKILDNILKDIKVKNGPNLKFTSFQDMPDKFDPKSGNIVINGEQLLRKPHVVAGSIRREVRHFEQFSLMARLEGGLDRLKDALFSKVQKNVIDAEKKGIDLNSWDLFDRSEFGEFWQGVIAEKGILKPNSADALRAEKYFQAFEKLSSKPDEATGILGKALSLPKRIAYEVNSRLNPLELDAKSESMKFAAEHKQKIDRMGKRFLTSSDELI